MKILLRKFDDKEYVWKDATYYAQRFVVDGNLIVDTNIVSVLNDNRNKLIKCSVCGKSFKNGSEEWTQHITPVTDTSKCFKCSKLRSRHQSYSDTQYTPNEDGTYTKTESSKVKLVCQDQYYTYNDINSKAARDGCVFNKCQNAKAIEFSDFFTQNPGAFDDIITANKVLDFGYKDLIVYGGEIKYQLKARNQIFACANKLNIIDHFDIYYRRERWHVYYSKKYNKLYSSRNNTYEVWNPYQIPESSMALILKKIAELYS